MRSGADVAVCGNARPSVGATSVQSPPAAGIETMFAAAPGATCRADSRKLRAGPWMAASRSPSADHAGFWKIAGRVLSRDRRRPAVRPHLVQVAAVRETR